MGTWTLKSVSAKNIGKDLSYFLLLFFLVFIFFFSQDFITVFFGGDTFSCPPLHFYTILYFFLAEF